MVVEVYRNLHRGCWSIRDKKTGLVVEHAAAVELTNCRLRVSEAGRQRVLREKRKNVHAWVEGTLVDVNRSDGAGLAPVTYNPYAAPTFTLKGTGEPVFTASRVVLAKGAFIEGGA